MSGIRALAIAKATGGSGGDVTVESLTATENKTYTAPSGKAYNPITVNVPNSYGAGDEGKIVVNGQLIEQNAQGVSF